MEPVDIFIAYSHEDLTLKNELKKFLRPLLREGRISLWDDFDIEAGQDWDATIKARLYGAGIVLLLVSSDSLASDYFYGKEVEVSLKRHASGEAIVVPVILRHCDWMETPLGSLEALPEKGRPVVEWATRDQAFQDVVARMRRVVETVENRRKNESAEAEAIRQFHAAQKAAMHLFAKQDWTEAIRAYTAALALYRPGFLPDRAELERSKADCEARIREIKVAAEAAERAEREQQVRLRREQEVEARRLIGDQPRSFNGVIISILLLAGLIAALLIWQPWKDSGSKPQEEKKVVLPEKPTIDTTQPKTATPSEDVLKRSKAKAASLVREANTFLKLDEPKRAIPLLEEALRLDPENKDAKAKLNSLK